MTTTSALPQREHAPQRPARALLRDLEHPSLVVRNLGPNWFSSVMGTGIVANAGALLPLPIPGLRTFATTLWILDTVLLAGLLALVAIQLLRYPGDTKRMFRDPAMAQFYGAPPMAMLTVGTGFMLLGPPVVGAHAALIADAVLWTAGTLTGLASALGIPLLMLLAHDFHPRQTSATWLMPLVPGVVAAGASALLLPHLPTGQERLNFLMLNYILFGLSMVPAAIIIVLLYARLMYHKLCAPTLLPTFWIVLGPVGTSIGALNLLGTASTHVLPAAASGLETVGLVYGLLMWGFGALWLAFSIILTVRAVRRHLPFALTWWAFTFPLGVFVTGTNELAARTGATMFQGAGLALYGLLVAIWVLVAVRTFHGSYRGSLFGTPPAASAPQPSRSAADDLWGVDAPQVVEEPELQEGARAF